MRRVITAQDVPAGGELRVPEGTIVTAVGARGGGVARRAHRRSAGRPADRAGARRSSTVAIGSDHGGFRLKEALKPLLESLGLFARDVGVIEEKPADYPDIAHEGRRTGGWRAAPRAA